MRRPHPYFNRQSRGDDAARPAPRRQVASEPLIKPVDEPGVLWDPFRDGGGPR